MNFKYKIYEQSTTLCPLYQKKLFRMNNTLMIYPAKKLMFFLTETSKVIRGHFYSWKCYFQKLIDENDWILLFSLFL